jgi:iron(II)-dependent oxidoreductase
MIPTTTPGALAGHLIRTRRATEALVAPLSDDDVHRQVVDHLSPLAWDLGHIGNVEEQWLLRRLGGRAPADATLDRLYDPFEQPRAVRGNLRLLPRRDALAYFHEVRGEVLAGLDRLDLRSDDPHRADGAVHRMVVQHEQQHLETMLQAIGLRTELPYTPATPDGRPTRRRQVDDEDRVAVPGAIVTIGTDERGWTHDNERPAHRVEVAPFVIDRFPVTTRRYAGFVADGGYDRPELWTRRGWSWLAETGHRGPQGWERARDGEWRVRRFGFLQPLDPAEPVQHVSWFEADAFARWAGGRLPTEHEWEVAAAWDPATGRTRRFPWGDAPPTRDRANVGRIRFGPAPVGSLPAGASAVGVEQLAGDVYEWTSSPFVGYPGFEAFPYREYSEVHFGGDYRVLRGSSWAIGESMARCTYRNWDHPYRRQIMAGVRVAYGPWSR